MSHHCLPVHCLSVMIAVQFKTKLSGVCVKNVNLQIWMKTVKIIVSARSVAGL